MYCNALKVLKERGFVEWSSHNEELDEHFSNNMVTGYIGFDPSADSLHVGNLVAIMGLAWMQRLGHRPIALAGGGTGRIGDPSGKSAERNLLSEEVISYNVGRIAKQLEHFLDFNCGQNSAVLVNNNEWLKKLNYIEFLRDIGKYFSVSFLVNRDYVRSRVIDPDKSITYTELSYILLQAYDFNHMYNELNCTLQMGGNDQQVNIIAQACINIGHQQFLQQDPGTARAPRVRCKGSWRQAMGSTDLKKCADQSVRKSFRPNAIFY